MIWRSSNDADVASCSSKHANPYLGCSSKDAAISQQMFF